MSKKILKASVSSLIALSCMLSFYSCNNQVDNNNIQKNTPSINNKENKKIENGTLKLTVDSNLLKTSSKDKELDLNKNVKKLLLEVKGTDLNTSIKATEKWESNKSTSFSLDLPEGNNRIVILSALDSGGRILSTFMGSLDIKSKQDNNVNLNSLETSVAQTLLNILNSSSKTLLNNLKNEDLKSYFKKLNIEPNLINTQNISDNIIKNNGKLPDDKLSNLEKTGNLKVNLNETGVKLLLSDLNSNIIESTTQNQVNIDKISLGEWHLTLLKDGLISQSVKVNIKDSENNITVNLPKDGRLPLPKIGKLVDVKVLEPIKSNEFGVSINNYVFSDGIDSDKDGGVERVSNGNVDLKDFGTHKINIKTEVFPVMSNEYNSLTITDENFVSPTGLSIKNEQNPGVLLIETDQELQHIIISFSSYKMELEANLDGSWTVTFADKETVINTVKDIENFILKNLALRNISIHSIATIYTLIDNREKLPMEVKERKTLGNLTGPGDAVSNSLSNYYNSRQNILELINKTLIALKNLRTMFEVQ